MDMLVNAERPSEYGKVYQKYPFKSDNLSITTAALVGICVGSTLVIVTLAAITYTCYRKRGANFGHGATMSLRSSSSGINTDTKTMMVKRPTAIRNTGLPGPSLKKSPSPTGSKSPPERHDGLGCWLDQSPKDHNENKPKTSGQDSPLKVDQIYIENEKENQKPAVGIMGGLGSSLKLFKTSQVPNAIEGEIIPVSKELEECLSVDTNDMVDKVKVRAVESEQTGDGECTKLGTLHFKLMFDSEKQALMVTIIKCSDLPARESGNATTNDPYVKLQLLPEKQHKVKTRVLRRTLNPFYDEDFTFYGLTRQQLTTTTLHFVVLSFDRFSRDDVIGEVLFPLEPTSDIYREKKMLEITKSIQPRNFKIRTLGRGELLVSLCYQPAANRLTVVVLKARNLPKMDITGLSDPYVKVYMIYNGQRIAKKKTHVKKRTLNPVFNESFVFDLTLSSTSNTKEGVSPLGSTTAIDSGSSSNAAASGCNLDKIHLEFLVLDWDRVTKNEVIGRLELGGHLAEGSGLHHWKEVVNAPRRQIAEWHKLNE